MINAISAVPVRNQKLSMTNAHETRKTQNVSSSSNALISKAASDALMQKMSAIGQRVYQEAAAQQQAQGNAGEQQGPAGAQDADFTDVN